MNSLDASSPSEFLRTREQYLKKFLNHISEYRPDSERQICSYIDRTPIHPGIHLLIKSLYENMLQNETEEAYLRYEAVQDDTIVYLKNKISTCQSVDLLSRVDLWTNFLPLREQSNYRPFVEASDHIEDTLFLCNVTAKHQLESAAANIEKEVAELVNNLKGTYFPLVNECLDSQKEKVILSLFGQVIEDCAQGTFSDTVTKISSIRENIKPLF